jgi:hypothetical protein
VQPTAGEFSGSAQFSIDLHQRFLKATRRARFYFGPEVDEYLETLRIAMLRGDTRLGFRGGITEDQFVAALDAVQSSYATLDRMFIPYMRLDQRMPNWWWSFGFVVAGLTPVGSLPSGSDKNRWIKESLASARH